MRCTVARRRPVGRCRRHSRQPRHHLNVRFRRQSPAVDRQRVGGGQLAVIECVVNQLVGAASRPDVVLLVVFVVGWSRLRRRRRRRRCGQLLLVEWAQRTLERTWRSLERAQRSLGGRGSSQPGARSRPSVVHCPGHSLIATDQFQRDLDLIGQRRRYSPQGRLGVTHRQYSLLHGGVDARRRRLHATHRPLLCPAVSVSGRVRGYSLYSCTWCRATIDHVTRASERRALRMRGTDCRTTRTRHAHTADHARTVAARRCLKNQWNSSYIIYRASSDGRPRDGSGTLCDCDPFSRWLPRSAAVRR